VEAVDWRNYSDQDIAQIGRRPTFIEDQGERTCPECGNLSVRQYIYRSVRRQQASLVGYAWCRRCQRFAGSVGPMPAGLGFTDPLENLTPEERVEIEDDLDTFFGRLDALWDSRSLPQEISR
jgi:hypothetical protein